jgi:hypothetical protein
VTHSTRSATLTRLAALLVPNLSAAGAAAATLLIRPPRLPELKLMRGWDDLRRWPDLGGLVDPLGRFHFAAKRSYCAPLAGKSTLIRLELSRPEATRYHKVRHDPAAI